MSAPDRPADRLDDPPALAASARRYSEQEVSLILRRAAELQVDASGTASGTSLAELESIAREAGLDPALVRRAASDLATAAPADPPSRFYGATRRLHVERVIDGELSSDDVEALINEVRRTFGDPGVVSTLGRTVTWSPSIATGYGRRSTSRQVYVTIMTRDGCTTLRAEEDLTQFAGGLFGGLMGGMGGGLTAPTVALGVGVFHTALPIVGLVGVLFGGTYTLARGVYAAVVRGREKGLRQLVERLGAYAARATTR